MQGCGEFAGIVGRLEYFFYSLWAVTHHARGVLSYTHHTRTCQCRKVKEVVCLHLLLRIAEYIGQYQSSFGIGVAYFDGLAAFGGEYIIRLVGISTNHIFHGTDEAMYFYRQIHLGYCFHDAQHG